MATKSKAKSIIRKGPSSGKKSNEFIAIKEDEPVNVVPILPTGEIMSIDLHAFWEINPAVVFACIKDADDAGEGCPGCNLGDKAGYRGFLPVLDADGELKILAFGISIERQLVTLEDELGTIVGKKLRIKRTGKGLSTKYQVINLGKETEIDVEEDDAIKFVESHIEIKDRSKIVDELIAAGLMKGKGKKVEDEELEEEVEDEDDEEVDEEEGEEEEEVKPAKKVVKAPIKKAIPTPKGKTVKKPAPAKKPVRKVKNDWDD